MIYGFLLGIAVTVIVVLCWSMLAIGSVSDSRADRFADVDALAKSAKGPRKVESYIPDDGDEHRNNLGAF